MEIPISDITLRPHMQEVLDTALVRASREAQTRFAAAVSVGAPTAEDSEPPTTSPAPGGMLLVSVVVGNRLVFVPFDDGELDECQRALDEAEQVKLLKGQVHTGGWLRFDGSRLAEERGACYVELGHPDLAELVLTQALSQELSFRRRGGVLIDLAMTGVQSGNLECLVMYADAALDAARQTGSGFIYRKLQILQTRLAPLLSDRHVRHLNEQITTVTRISASR